jgi:hypothetical protein
MNILHSLLQEIKSLHLQKRFLMKIKIIILCTYIFCMMNTLSASNRWWNCWTKSNPTRHNILSTANKQKLDPTMQSTEKTEIYVDNSNFSKIDDDELSQAIEDAEIMETMVEKNLRIVNGTINRTKGHTRTTIEKDNKNNNIIKIYYIDPNQRPVNKEVQNLHNKTVTILCSQEELVYERIKAHNGIIKITQSK